MHRKLTFAMANFMLMEFTMGIISSEDVEMIKVDFNIIRWIPHQPQTNTNSFVSEQYIGHEGCLLALILEQSSQWGCYNLGMS